MKQIILYLKNLAENNMLINPPRKILLIYWFVLTICEFALVSVSSGLMLFITIPLLAILLCFFLFFMRAWRSFRYSTVIALIPLIVGFVIAILLGDTIRGLLLSLINMLLR